MDCTTYVAKTKALISCAVYAEHFVLQFRLKRMTIRSEELTKPMC